VLLVSGIIALPFFLRERYCRALPNPILFFLVWVLAE